MDDRKKQLEAFIKRFKLDGQMETNGLIDPKQHFMNQALDARDITQSALAHEVLKNTGVPIPGKGARSSSIEDFYQRIMQERYPELDANVDVADLTKENARGLYYSGDKLKWIEMQKGLLKKDPASAVGTLLHEAGHQYDDVTQNFRGKPLDHSIRNAGLSPADTYEIASNGHHKEFIPGQREGGSFGKGALTSLLKNGTFRAMGPLSTAAQVVPAIADVKEGNPNTAAARMVSSLAPAGSEQLQDKLMEEANIEDKYPHLKDSTYLRTLKNIGERRAQQGKSPVVEGFNGEQIDTSATEDSDILNKIKAKMRQNSQG